jgi:hypothetical protein
MVRTRSCVRIAKSAFCLPAVLGFLRMLHVLIVVMHVCITGLARRLMLPLVVQASIVLLPGHNKPETLDVLSLRCRIHRY